MRNIEKIIREVNGTMSIEGMPITAQDKTRILACAGNKELVDKKVAQLVAKHTAKSPRNHV